MLYEQKKEYKKAAMFWKERVALGIPDDPWVKKAEARLVKLRELVPDLQEEYLQQEADDLSLEIYSKKRNETLLQDAKKLYKESEYQQAIETLNLLLSYNPANKQELLDLKEEIQTEAEVAAMEDSFQDVMNYYRQDNLHRAQNKLDNIAAEITSGLKK